VADPSSVSDPSSVADPSSVGNPSSVGDPWSGTTTQTATERNAGPRGSAPRQT